MRIGIYGSSFDPITNVHIFTASAIARRMQLDKVIFLPCSSKHRADDKKMKAFDEHRIAMVKMAIESRKHFELSTYEMDYDHGLATTYETMKYFQELYPNDELFFIMGADLLVDLPNWRQGKELVEGFQFIVMNRDEYDMLKIIAKNPLLRNNNRNFHLLDKGIAMEISSTFIRDEIAMGGDPSGLLPDNCLQYILDNGLYTNAITNKIGLIR